MRTAIPRVLAAAIVLSTSAACAGSEPGDPTFAPVIAPAPQGIARVLIPLPPPVTVPMPGMTGSPAVEVNFCSVALRDPVTRTQYQLVQTRDGTEPAGAVTGGPPTVRSEANYTVRGNGIRLPAGTYLRVACATSEVVGLAADRGAGT